MQNRAIQGESVTKRSMALTKLPSMEISMEDIERCVAMMAAAKAMVVRVELGIQQGVNSTLNSYLEKLLIMLTGSFGRKGTNQLHAAALGQFAGAEILGDRR